MTVRPFRVGLPSNSGSLKFTKITSLAILGKYEKNGEEAKGGAGRHFARYRWSAILTPDITLFSKYNGYYNIGSSPRFSKTHMRNTKSPTSYKDVFLFTLLTNTSLNAQTNSDANPDAADEASPPVPPSKQGTGPSSKPVRRRRAGQPPAPVGLAEEPESEPATTRKRHKRRAGTLTAIFSKILSRAR